VNGERDPVQALWEAARAEARRRALWWVLGVVAGGGCLLPLLVILLIAVMITAALLAWLPWASWGSPHAARPPVPPPVARVVEWLPSIDRVAGSVPNTWWAAAVAASTRGNAQAPGGLLGLRGVGPVGVLPGLQAAAPSLDAAMAGPWQPGWSAWSAAHQRHPAALDAVGLDLRAYRQPVVAAWALAPWASDGHWQDPGHQPVWVLVVAAAPVGPPWRHALRPPTRVCAVARPPHKPPHAVCRLVTHDLTGRTLLWPVAVVGHTATGQAVRFAWSGVDAQVPVWPGGGLWGALVPITGPHRLTTIQAIWPGDVTVTIRWNAHGIAVGIGRAVDVNATLAHWWPAILAASHATGVPAPWIAAEMLVESGGYPEAGTLQGAYGLMQLEPGTDGCTDAQREDPAQNLLCGARYLAGLHQDTGSWRLASAAYYGGLGFLEQQGVALPTTWAAAQGALNVVPDPQAGNVLTLAAYAASVNATAQAVQHWAVQHHQPL
jgi:hypothetical protein